MKMNKKILALLACLSLSPAAHAELIDRGNGLIYDTVLNVTWLQDAGLSGEVSWDQALGFIDSLNNTNYLGRNDWRLPQVKPINGQYYVYGYSYDGGADTGYGITSPQSELAYMYYVNLGLKALYTASGEAQEGYGVPAPNLTSTDGVLIKNLYNAGFWTVNAYYDIPNSSPGYASTISWEFFTSTGAQATNQFQIGLGPHYAWAVLPGDVATVPEPGAWGMMLAGLVLVGLAKHRRTSTAFLPSPPG